MRENRTCGSEGGAAELNRSFLPLSFMSCGDAVASLLDGLRVRLTLVQLLGQPFGNLGKCLLLGAFDSGQFPVAFHDMASQNSTVNSIGSDGQRFGNGCGSDVDLIEKLVKCRRRKQRVATLGRCCDHESILTNTGAAFLQRHQTP